METDASSADTIVVSGDGLDTIARATRSSNAHSTGSVPRGFSGMSPDNETGVIAHRARRELSRAVTLGLGRVGVFFFVSSPFDPPFAAAMVAFTPFAASSSAAAIEFAVCMSTSTVVPKTSTESPSASDLMNSTDGTYRMGSWFGTITRTSETTHAPRFSVKPEFASSRSSETPYRPRTRSATTRAIVSRAPSSARTEIVSSHVNVASVKSHGVELAPPLSDGFRASLESFFFRET